MIDRLIECFPCAQSEVVSENPTVFLSYTGRYELRYFVEMLGHLEGDFIWMDIFCVDQFAWTGKSRTPELKAFREKLIRDLQGNIKKIGKTVLLLEKWNSVMSTLGQIWVLWEIFSTVQVETDFSIMLPESETNNLLNAIESGNKEDYNVMESLSTIDCDRAVAEDDDDRAAIFQLMKAAGLYNVSCAASELIREWICTKCIDRGHAVLLTGEEESIAGLSNLGLAILEHGKFDKAEDLLTNAFMRSQRVFGDNHIVTLKVRMGVASMWGLRGDLEKARSVYRQMSFDCHISADKRTDPIIFVLMSNLASQLRMQGEFDEAELLYRKAIACFQQLLGSDHQDTLSAISGLADLLRERGKLQEAEQCSREVVSRYVQVLGVEHPDTLMAITNMAEVLRRLGSLEEAELCAGFAVKNLTRILGETHRSTLLAMCNLGAVLFSQGKTEMSAVVSEETVKLHRIVFGDEHPETLNVIHNMASILGKLEKAADALLLCEEALSARRRTLGEEHSKTLASEYLMCLLLRLEGRLAEALCLFEVLLPRRRQKLGNEHEQTLMAMNGLAGVLLHSGERLDEAESFAVEAFTGFYRKLGPDHNHTKSTAAMIRNLYEAQGKGEEFGSFLFETMVKADLSDVSLETP